MIVGNDIESVPSEIHSAIQVENRLEQPEDCMFLIDGELLHERLREAGFPSSVLEKKIVITDSTSVVGGGRILGGDSITINQNTVVRWARQWYGAVLRRLGEDSSDVPVAEGFWEKFASSELIQYIYPLHWYIHFIKRDFRWIVVPRDRVLDYTSQAMDDGRSSNDRINEIEHSKRVLARLLRVSIGRQVGGIIAHEYEHANREIFKFVRFAAMQVSTFFASAGLLSLYKMMAGSPLPLEPYWPAVALMVSITEEAWRDEQESIDASIAYADSLRACIAVDPDVFERLVIKPFMKVD